MFIMLHALRDMRKCGIDTTVFIYEEAILEFTKNDCKSRKKPDFRKFNGKIFPVWNKKRED